MRVLSLLTALSGTDRGQRLRRFLRLAVLASVVEGLTVALAVPVLTRLLSPHPATALPWLAALLVGAAASLLLHHTATLRGFDTAIDLLTTLRHRVGDHVATLPLGWFTRERTGRLSHTLSTGVMEILALPAHQLGSLVRALITPTTLVIATAFTAPALALVAALVVPAVLAAFWWAGRLGRRADAAVATTAAATTDRLVEFARSQPVLRAFGRPASTLTWFDDALDDLRRAERRQLWLVLPPVTLNGVLARTTFLVLLATATALAIGSPDPAGVAAAVALLIVVNRIAEPLSEVAAHATAIRMALTQMDAVQAVLDTPPLPTPDRPAPTPERADVELRGVSFGYRPDQPVLHDVNLTLAQGSMTALVGTSGSGKTTLTRLIARFWDVTHGSVRIGGHDVRDLSTTQLISMVAPVFQDTWLFAGTLRDNLIVARPDATDTDIAHAADTARVTEIVERLPNGWDTQVGEAGTRLSGGERQRISLARALLKQAPIILLDEVTGALDAENQAAVTDGLLRLRGRHTMLVIAHQLPTIAAADMIVVLEGGRIVEHGQHDDLLAAGGRYAAFWTARAQAQGWRLIASRTGT